MYCDGCGKKIKTANELGLCIECEKEELGIPNLASWWDDGGNDG